MEAIQSGEEALSGQLDIDPDGIDEYWTTLDTNLRAGRLRLIFVADEIPLELRSPEAIAVLAGTITMTPGTVSADLSSDGRSLLVHCLDAADPDDVVASIKSRYERRLKEIFE